MSTETSQPDQSAAGPGQFPVTQWSLVINAAGTQDKAGRNALEQLCRTYWYPLYAYVRRRGFRAPDAEDLTQAYFEKLLEKHYLGQADRDRGKFRTFLLTSLKNFLANEWDRGMRLKRGGQFQFVSWEHAGGEERYQREPASALSPDALYDRAWVYSLLEGVMKRLRQEYSAAGKTSHFDALKGYLTSSSDAPPYAETAEQLGLGESAMKMAVLRLRKRYGARLREEIAQTVVSPGEVEEELRHLSSLLG